MTLAVDMVITFLIIWGLRQNRTGWSETDRLIQRIVTSVRPILQCKLQILDWLTSARRISIESQLPSTLT